MNLSNIKGKINTAKIFKSKGIGLGNKVDINKNRLPPGQRLLNDPLEFPILDLGVRPEFNRETYRFKVFGLVDNPIELSLDELIKNFKKSNLTLDFHCVTRWSKYDVNWGGVKLLDLLSVVKPQTNAKYLLQYGLDSYTTNVVLDEVSKDNVLLAYELDGKPLPLEHGAPLRLIIPELYAWKGSKFLTALEFSDVDKSGFWEVRGYHNHGDPWLEERYS